MHRGGLPKSFKLLLGIAAGLIGLGVLATGLAIMALRGDAIRNAQQNAGNLATILAQQTTYAVRTIDDKLTQLQQQVAETGAEDLDELRIFMQNRDTYFDLKRQLVAAPQADVILIVGADGSLVNSTRRWPLIDLDLADRDYFQYFRSHDVPDLFIGLPVNARLVGTKTLYISKRLNSRSGVFLGVVAIGVPLGYFEHIYDSINDLKGQSFLFLRRDGTVLIRYPDTADRAGMKMPPDSPWFELVRTGGGTYRSPGYFDGGARLAAVRPLSGFPLVVNVGANEDAVLETWRRRAILIALATLLAVGCTALLLWALARQIRRLAFSEFALAEREAGLADKSRELEHVNAQLDAAVNNMSQGLCLFDKDGRLVLRNDRFLAMYDLPADRIMPGCRPHDIIKQRLATDTFLGDPDEYIATVMARIDEGQPFYQSSELADGRVIAVSCQPVAGGGWVATHEDITERQKVEARIAHMARHDALTQLANRVLFVERLDAAIERMRRLDDGFAVFVFDIDLFKAVNDTLGHAIGDELLRQIAHRLENVMQPGWTVARVGGDEFAVIQIDEADQRAAAIGLAETIIEQVGEPFDIDGHRIVLGISIGIAMAPHDGTDAAEFLKNADLALSRAKAEGRMSYRFFEPEMDAAARLHRALEIDLRNALMRQEFELHYQPVVDIASHRICGAEALIRWRHPEHGLVAPDRFIPIAEETGIIIPMGEWILRAACAEAATWPSSVKLAVNLSPIQFRSPRLVDTVREALARSGLPPQRLELEVTESVLLQKDDGNLAILHELADIGVSIALDDFGTGYSSLSYLRTFPFEKIKIDRSFIAELGERDDCGAIVSAITGLGRSLDVVTTAEGVETRDQLALLRAAGCSQAQGYLFSRPLPAAEIDFGTDYAHLKAAWGGLPPTGSASLRSARPGMAQWWI